MPNNYKHGVTDYFYLCGRQCLVTWCEKQTIRPEKEIRKVMIEKCRNWFPVTALKPLTRCLVGMAWGLEELDVCHILSQTLPKKGNEKYQCKFQQMESWVKITTLWKEQKWAVNMGHIEYPIREKIRFVIDGKDFSKGRSLTEALIYYPLCLNMVNKHVWNDFHQVWSFTHWFL